MVQPKLNNWYPFEVWFLTILLIGPFLQFVLGMFIHEKDIFFIGPGFYLILIVGGLIMSIPFMLISYAIFASMVTHKISGRWYIFMVATVGFSVLIA